MEFKVRVAHVQKLLPFCLWQVGETCIEQHKADSWRDMGPRAAEYLETNQSIKWVRTIEKVRLPRSVSPD
jgi:hypothetical protein